MFNQEQLAAIAAAVSILQQSMRQQQPLQSQPQQQSIPQSIPQPIPQLKPEHDQQQATINHQTSTAANPSRPISYSAIVAKSAGLTVNANNNMNQNASNSVTSSFVNNDNVISGTTTSTIASHNNFRNVPVMNSFRDGLNHANSSGNSTSPFCSATSNHLSGGNSESMSTFTNTNGLSIINDHGSRAAAQQQHQLQQQQQHTQYLASLSNQIIRNAMNNNLASNTNIDIFNTNNLTGSLGHANGSSLLKQRNSNNLLSLESPLEGYNSDYPISPAQQSFNQQNYSFRHSQLSNPAPIHQQNQNNNHSGFNTDIMFNTITNSRDKTTPTYGRATNLLGFMGLYVGNLSPELSKEQLEKIFSKYGEPVKAHRLIRSPVAFIKYENTESPRAAIDDLYGLLLPELTLNPDQPLKLHFDRNDAQLKANYRPTELPKEDNGECYGWRTTVCKRGKSCSKKHIPINRGIDFQMWMIKSNSTSTTGTTSTVTATLTTS